MSSRAFQRAREHDVFLAWRGENFLACRVGQNDLPDTKLNVYMEIPSLNSLAKRLQEVRHQTNSPAGAFCETGFSPRVFHGEFRLPFRGPMRPLSPEQESLSGEFRESRRRWDRLPIVIPIFVRGSDDHNGCFMEFSAATNLNAGGLLLMTRRNLSAGMEITLEIPTPSPELRPAGQESFNPMPATILYTNYAEGFHWCGVKFTTPLLPDPDDE